MESEEGISLTPSLVDFTKLDVDDQGGLFKKYINPEIINIITSNGNNSLSRTEKGETGGWFKVAPDSIKRIQKGEVVDIVLYLDYSDPEGVLFGHEVNTHHKFHVCILTKNT